MKDHRFCSAISLGPPRIMAIKYLYDAGQAGVITKCYFFPRNKVKLSILFCLLFFIVWTVHDWIVVLGLCLSIKLKSFILDNQSSQDDIYCQLKTAPIFLLLNDNNLVMMLLTNNCPLPLNGSISYRDGSTTSFAFEIDKTGTNRNCQGFLLGRVDVECSNIDNRARNSVSYINVTYSDKDEVHRIVWRNEGCSKQIGKEEIKEKSGFAIVSDNQKGRLTFLKILRELGKKLANNDDAQSPLIHLGDSVQHGSILGEWMSDFLDPLAFSLYSSGSHKQSKIMPLVLSRGNHDPTLPFDSLLQTIVRSSPTHLNLISDKGSHDNGFYYVVLQNILFIVLNSNYKGQSQVEWLRNVLIRYSNKGFPGADFCMVSVHIPPFGEFWDPLPWQKGEKHWGDHVVQYFLPLFEEFQVDIVWSGHQHNYQRGRSEKGVFYVIIGTGGSDLDYERVEDYQMYTKTLFRHLFAIMETTSDQVTITVYDHNGVTYDEFYVHKKEKR